MASASGFDAKLHAGLPCTGCDPTTGTPILVSAPGTVSGSDFALSSKSLQFFTLSPCRVLDTRNPVGALGGPALAAQSDRFFLALGSCGVPKTARALSVNVAVTGATAPGNLRLHAGRTGVPLVSAINHSAGRTRSNNAIVPLNGIGELAVFCGQSAGTTAHFILDVNGYFE